mgnify:CR=1 FL=1
MKNHSDKLTKIVATIGPATETEEILEKIIRAGVNIARFNTKHGTPEWHHERILRVKKIAKELNTAVAVLMDLQGPEIRINLPDEGEFKMEEGDKAFFSYKEDLAEENLILIPENVVDVLEKGHLILVDDGLCQFEVTKKVNGVIEVKALDNFTVKHRKTMSIPGVVTDMPVLIENDFVQLDGIKNDEVDYVALSFVRNRQDVETLRTELEKRDLSAGIISKIENQSALDNLDEIIDASDGLMIARGDLGVEVPFEELIFWQKKMIRKCRAAGKPVITATHMLETMIENPLPTRAEISDVANAVYDKTDAVMLSGETTIGKFPVRVVNTQARIVQFNEQNVDVDLTDYLKEVNHTNVVDAAIYLLAHELKDIDAVVCLTETGRTAAEISRSRPKLPIHVLTSTKKVYNQLALHFGLIPHLVDWEGSQLINAKDVMSRLGKVDWVKSGQKVLIIYGQGHRWRQPGKTNTLSLIEVE